MVLKAERERIKALLTEAITVLCKNGLGYKYTCGIEGLLGITLDDEDVFLVNINETIQGAERRPTAAEEETKESATAPQSPATASPSSTPRRRRRRSQDGQEGGSPAKRANYGDDQQQEPQNPDDVIVIKEEVSETEFSDFYGDTGGGNSQDGGQYAMPQGDQYGAGCSQWGDTSQTQGGQPEWPTFSPTQQQAAISQAASSAMMSPSQGIVSISDSVKCGTLRSTVVKEILSRQVVDPAIAWGWTIAAFRMSWPKQSDESVQAAWDNIVSIRQEMDQMALGISGVKFLISAISATSSRAPKEPGGYRNTPGVAYWMALENGVNTRTLVTSMQENSFGAQLKLQLQPFQKTQEQISNALFTCVKDNMEGCVRRLVEEGQRRNHRDKGVLHPVVKLFVQDMNVRNMFHPIVQDLIAARFPIDMHEMF